MSAVWAPWLALIIGCAVGWVGNDLRRSWASKRRTPVGIAGHPNGNHLHYVRGFPWHTRYEHATDVCWCKR